MPSPRAARPRASARPVGRAGELWLIGAGGACGAVARAGFCGLLATWGLPDLLTTQAVNATGAFALGLLLAWLETTGPRPGWRAFLAVGVLGSFTTFSTLVADGHVLSTTTPSAPARSLLLLLFLAVSLAIGLAAFGLAGLLHRRLAPIASPDEGEPT